ncbi:hypothetical protein SKAU_G00365470 [Synaphobranchus kaupii]|uniref:Platelet-derived growth factor (PDGF) family profile domain-containing protein n=1 Tax=Synaphobranchus kaupii TaxID=118154 RepID=A0A9Q1EF05_SYNKA|nr:hypothetical protein SKAU_G00365470 [Synaphobranchus kaupii]
MFFTGRPERGGQRDSFVRGLLCSKSSALRFCPRPEPRVPSPDPNPGLRAAGISTDPLVIPDTMRILPMTLWILWVWNGSGFEGDYLEGADSAEPGGTRQRGLGAVSSVDDLLELLYPPYALVQRCLRRRAQGTPSPLRPGEVTWGNPREAALHRDDGAILLIMAEIERTVCRPREVCLEVTKEYPESTRHIYLPRCVSVHRCGGCCSHEGLHCYNTSHKLVNKTLVQLSPSQMERSVVMVTFLNHTACECRPKRPPHAVIRRAADAHRALCTPPGVPCSAGLVWDPTACLCAHRNTSSFSESKPDPLDTPLLALCGPNKVLDPEHCGCACRNGLTESGCVPGRRLDNATCDCVCVEFPQGRCHPGQRWDTERCTCACLPNCPRGHAPQPGTCLCRCRENPRTCLLQGKRFNPQTCSCYRLPCRTPHRKCPPGFYFSHYVCNCIPDHMRTDELN